MTHTDNMMSSRLTTIKINPKYFYFTVTVNSMLYEEDVKTLQNVYVLELRL